MADLRLNVPVKCRFIGFHGMAGRILRTWTDFFWKNAAQDFARRAV